MIWQRIKKGHVPAKVAQNFQKREGCREEDVIACPGANKKEDHEGLKVSGWKKKKK